MVSKITKLSAATLIALGFTGTAMAANNVSANHSHMNGKSINEVTQLNSAQTIASKQVSLSQPLKVAINKELRCFIKVFRFLDKVLLLSRMQQAVTRAFRDL